MLCDACKKAVHSFQNSQPGSWRGPKPELFAYPTNDQAWRGAHHHHDGTFASAVRSGCYICCWLLEACPHETRELCDSFRTFYALSRISEDSYTLRMVIELHQRSPIVAARAQVIEHSGGFKILPKSLIPEASGRLSLTQTTLGSKCREQVQRWLSDCTSQHHLCNEDWRTTFDYPIRLLSIGLADEQCVKLELWGQDARLPLYVTMSHCWDHGQGLQSVMLTQANSQRLSHGFAIGELPRRFRDAIEIARWMKVHYLWVDALCILQDSHEDWRQQSSIMGDIYAGSYCNIAATNADSGAGCFAEREPDTVEPCVVSRRGLTESTETHVIGYDDFWCNSLLETALHTRAWVLQERILSPRTVHFGQDQVFWECRRLKACESYPNGIPAQFSKHRTNAWRLGQDLFSPSNTTTEDRGFFQWASSLFWRWVGPSRPQSETIRLRQAWELWGKTVERYMECYLTYGSDKLVALSGLASKLAETTSERYLAGIYENSQLPQSLLWYVPVREQANGRSSVRAPPLGQNGYRAPSWSWASVDAQIKWEHPSECQHDLVRDIKTEIVSRHEHSAGSLFSAKIHLQALLFDVRLELAHSLRDGSPDEDGSYVLSFPGLHTNLADTLDADGESLRQLEPIVFLDLAQRVRTVEAYLLPICTQWRRPDGKILAALAGLLLKKSTLEGMTVYERLGVVCLDDDEVRLLGAGFMDGTVGSQGLTNDRRITLI